MWRAGRTRCRSPAPALPEKCVALFDLIRHGRTEEARALQDTLMKASRRIVSDTGIAGLKFAMDQRGYRGGLPRLPLLPVSDRSKQDIREFLATMEPATARA